MTQLAFILAGAATVILLAFALSRTIARRQLGRLPETPFDQWSDDQLPPEYLKSLRHAAPYDSEVQRNHV